MSKKQIIIHGLLHDVIDYAALFERDANANVTRVPIQKNEVTRGRQKIKQNRRTNRK